MATKHFGLVIYGCAIAAILRSQGVASAPVQGSEAASVQANQITDLEQQLMQQSGENKSSHPAPSSVNEGEMTDPENAPDDALADEAEATGISSDYYGLPSPKDTIDDATHLEQWNNQLKEDSNEDNLAAEGGPAATAAEGGEEEDANTDRKPLDEGLYNGRHQEVNGFNFGERSFEDDVEEIEHKEKNREIHNDDLEQIERPWEEEEDFESQEAPPSELVASEKTIIKEGETQEIAREEEKEQQKSDEEDGQKIRDNRQKLEQQRYLEDGQDNSVTTFDSRLLISREKKTFQGRRLPAELDKSDRHKVDEGLRYVDDDFTGYM